MNISAKITGIKYKVICTDDLKELNFRDFNINAVPTCFLLTDKQYNYGISKWVSPIRTRSYPFERVYNTLNIPKRSAKKSALYGKNGSPHKIFDHERFANVMKQTKHKWLITYDDSEYIRNLFSFANIKTWDLTYRMRNVNKESNQLGKELFVSNYNLVFNKYNNYNLFEAEASRVSE